MSDNRSSNVHAMLRFAILIGFALYISHLLKTGDISFYIAPRMVIYVKLTAIVLYAAGAFQAYSSIRSLWKEQKSCGCEHTPSSSLSRNFIAYGLFALPLLLGLFLPDTAMSSALAEKKGMILNSGSTISKTVQTYNSASASPSPSPAPAAAASQISSEKQDSGSTAASSLPANPTDAQLDEMFQPDKFNEEFANLGKRLYRKDSIQVPEKGFIEVLSALDLFQDNFIGKTIDLTGFVYREDDMKDNQLVVSRFQIQCCSADATPFGIMLESPLAKDYPKDTWIHVTGKLGKTTYAGNEIMKVDATKITVVPAYKTPYVYPDIDFLLQTD